MLGDKTDGEGAKGAILLSLSDGRLASDDVCLCSCKNPQNISVGQYLDRAGKTPIYGEKCIFRFDVFLNEEEKHRSLFYCVFLTARLFMTFC